MFFDIKLLIVVNCSSSSDWFPTGSGKPKDTFRESDNFFDAVIIPYQIGSSDLYSITKGNILKEAFRIVKEKGVVIIHGYTELPIVEHGLLNIFIKWVKNFYSDLKTCSEEEFNEELLKAGARDVEVFLYRGYLFGIGRK